MEIIFGIMENDMTEVIYFDNENQQKDRCTGQVYFDFLDYAFEETDFFMLVYVNYYGKGYSKEMKFFKNALKPFQIKSRGNPSWPGTLKTFCPQTSYKIVFYNNCNDAKEILKQVNKMSDWSSPSLPQDLAFFKGNTCWFYSVGHEKISAIIRPTQKDIDFVSFKKLAARNSILVSQDDFFDAYNEQLEVL